jgi:hypothetical protein
MDKQQSGAIDLTADELELVAGGSGWLGGGGEVADGGDRSGYLAGGGRADSTYTMGSGS